MPGSAPGAGEWAYQCVSVGISEARRPQSDIRSPKNGFRMVSPFCSQYFRAIGQ